MSENINQVLERFPIVTTGKELKPIVTTDTIGKINRGEKYLTMDQLFDYLSDLVNETFRPWYCKQFYRLGRERTLILASQARNDGRDKRKLFSHLLKENAA